MTDWVTGLVGIAGTLTTYFAGSRDARERGRARKEEKQETKSERVFAAYNAVLQYDGANYIVNIPPHERLNVLAYRTEVRPKLFAELHIIHKDVREQLHRLDSTIAHIDVMGENGEDATDEEFNAVQQYWDMIQTVQRHYTER